MNLYEKLADARVKFQEKNIKKSGYNKFSNYYYYELNDILPAVNYICKELKLLTQFIVYEGIATLSVIDTEQEDSFIEFSLPYAGCQLKSMHEVQNLGASQTYLKRYLYQNAFEIAENDSVDYQDYSTKGKEAIENNKTKDTLTVGIDNATLILDTKEKITATEWTREQKEEFANIIKSVDSNGVEFFSDKEKEPYRKMLKMHMDFESSKKALMEALKNKQDQKNLDIF